MLIVILNIGVDLSLRLITARISYRAPKSLKNSMSLDKFLELLGSLKGEHGFPSDQECVARTHGLGVQGESSGARNGEERLTEKSCENALGHMLEFEQGVPLVNLALGMMRYQAPTVCNTMNSVLVDTLASILGLGGFSAANLRHIAESFDALNANGKISGPYMLAWIETLLKAATALSTSTSETPQFCSVYTKARSQRAGQSPAAWAVEQVMDFCLKDKQAVLDHLSPSARLHAWRLHPSLLKQNLSDLAHHAMQHPLRSLKLELRNGEVWGTLIVSLALAPDVFAEARRLLYSWFLSMRAVRLMELRMELVAAVRDVLEHPTSWGFVGEDCGVDLPPFHAFYCGRLRPFLRVFIGPPSVVGLRQLVGMLDFENAKAPMPTSTSNVDEKSRENRKRKRCDVPAQCKMGESGFQGGRGIEKEMLDAEDEGVNTKCDGVPSGGAKSANRVAEVPKEESFFSSACRDSAALDHNSVWALLTDFLQWIDLAFQMLFENPRGELQGCQAAARYIAWVMSPIDKDGRAYAETALQKIAENWHILFSASAQRNTDKLEGKTAPYTLENKSSLTHQGLLADSGVPSRNKHEELVCDSCGTPVHLLNPMTKTWNCTDDGIGGLPRPFSKNGTLHALQGWLLDLCKLGIKLQQFHEKEIKRAGNIHESSHSSSASRAIFRALPLLGFKADSSLLDADSGGLLLAMVIIGGAWMPVKEVDEDNSGSSTPACHLCSFVDHLQCSLCCPSDHLQLVEPPHRTENVRVGGQLSNQTVKIYQLQWVPVAAALFNSLDTKDWLHGFDVPATDQSKEECAVDGTVNSRENVVGLAASCILHWTSSVEAHPPKGSLIQQPVLQHCMVMLEDLRCRFIDWADHRRLSTKAESMFSKALEALELKIASLKNSLFL